MVIIGVWNKEVFDPEIVNKDNLTDAEIEAIFR